MKSFLAAVTLGLFGSLVQTAFAQPAPSVYSSSSSLDNNAGDHFLEVEVTVTLTYYSHAHGSNRNAYATLYQNNINPGPLGLRDFTESAQNWCYGNDTDFQTEIDNNHGGDWHQGTISEAMSLNWYNLFQIAAVAPTSSNTSVAVNTPWTPSMSGSSGGGAMFHVAGYTNWDVFSWTPTSTGQYTFYVGTDCHWGYSGNATDPIRGRMEVNYTAYTLTVY